MLLVIFWLAAIVCSAFLDRPVAQWVHEHSPYTAHRLLFTILKLPGHAVFFTLPVAGLILVFHREHWRACALVLLSAAVGGLFYTVVKWTAGRSRPFKGVAPFDPFALHPFARGLRGLIHAEANLAFPSGHATLAFATAAALAHLLPRFRWAFYVIAGLAAVERVLEGAHYPSDVLAGAALGVLSAHLVLAVSAGRRGGGGAGASGRGGGLKTIAL